MTRQTILAIDNETFLIERDRPWPPVVCTSWAHGGDLPGSGVMPHTSVEAAVTRWLQGGMRFVGHNIAYDFATLAASYPHLLVPIFDAYKAGRVTDTQLRQQLVMIAAQHIVGDADAVRGYGLAALYVECFDEPMPGPGADKGTAEATPDHVRYRYGDLYNVDFVEWSDDAVEYARIDAVSTLKIHDLQQSEAGTLLRDDAFQAYSAFVLSLITANGMRTDPGRVAALKARETAAAAEIEPELVAAGMLVPKYRGRGKDKKQVGWTKKMLPARERIEAACKAQGLEPMLTTTGEKLQRRKDPLIPVTIAHVSVDRVACIWAGDALMLRRADYVSHQKILETYVPVLEQGYTLPITSRFGLAATGRTTASAPEGPP